MIEVDLDREHGVALLRPAGPLQSADFERVRGLVDPWIDRHGALDGLVVATEDFPGWAGFRDFLDHVRFVRAHHEHVKRVALVTDTPLADLGERIGGRFLAAEIRHFDFTDLDAALAWAAGRD